jgi:membrane protein
MPTPETNTAPGGPTDLNVRSWKGVATRTFREFKEDNLTDWAAALTYYGVLAIFPALLALVSILGLVGPSATQPLIDNLNAVAPGPANQPGRGVPGPDRRHRAGDLVGVGVRGGVHARVQRDL